MKILDLKLGKEVSLSENDTVSCAIGNFDGVHLGHRALIGIAAKKNGNTSKSAVWTFREPSSKALGGVKLLSSMEERFAYFARLGIDLVFIEDFDAVRDLSPEEFVHTLYHTCHVRCAVCGFNFRYGKMAKGNAETLKASMEALGASAKIVPPYLMEQTVVSSTAIRAALAEGDVQTATQMLGRPYSLTAKILHGKKLGRTLGFPTANQTFPMGRQIPRYGVYIVSVEVDGAFYGGVANVGVRPTVETDAIGNCETYLLHFSGDLYGKTVTTHFLKFLRPERKFSSVEELTAAVSENAKEAEAYFRKERT